MGFYVSGSGPDMEEPVTGFFEERQGAAVLKHGILRSYLAVFASKTGKWSTGHRVVYLDGYAGAGKYADGTPGSPMLAVETAQKLSAFRNVEGIYVEQDETTYHELCSNLKGVPGTHRTLLGSLEDHLDSVLTQTADAPLFAFLDPFGLGLSFTDITTKILPRSRKVGPVRLGPPTEVLLNFSLSGLRRNAGHLTAGPGHPNYERARPALLARVDRALGGDWWQPIWTSNAASRVGDIITEYVNRLGQAAGGWGYWWIPVADRWDGPPQYFLVFLTQHSDGLWWFNQSLSKATEEFYDFCHRGQLDLDPLEVRKSEWIAVITKNLEGLLASGSPIRVRQQMEAIYGATLGYARETHLRAAVKGLYEAGKTATTGKGEVVDMVILPPPHAA